MKRSVLEYKPDSLQAFTAYMHDHPVYVDDSNIHDPQILGQVKAAFKAYGLGLAEYETETTTHVTLLAYSRKNGQVVLVAALQHNGGGFENQTARTHNPEGVATLLVQKIATVLDGYRKSLEGSSNPLDNDINPSMFTSADTPPSATAN